MATKQAAMDFQNEDLPLFSGTPVRVSLEPAPALSRGSGQSSFFACAFCKDGGHVAGGGYCFCEAGTAARLADREKGETK